MLHIINKSSLQTSTLDSCLRVAKPGSAVLLIEDAVVAAAAGNATEAKLRKAAQTMKVYVLKPDMDARGLSAKVIDCVSFVDYGGFVDLTLEHNATQSWL